MAEKPVINVAERRNLAAEVVAKGAKEAAKATSLRPDQQEVANAAAQNLSAEGGRSALSTLGSEFKHGAAAPNIIERMAYSDIDPTGKLVPQGTEKARADGMKAQVDVLKKILLDPTDKTITPKDWQVVQVQIATVLGRDPDTAKAFGISTAKPMGDTALIVRVLSSAEGRAAVAKALNGAFEGSKDALTRVAELDAKSRGAQLELSNKLRTYEKLQKQKKGYADAATDLNNFNMVTDVKVPGSVDQTGGAAMTLIDGQLKGSGVLGVNSFEQNLADLAAKQAEYNKTANPALVSDITKIQGWVDKAKLDPTWGPKCTIYEQQRNRIQNINERIAKSSNNADMDSLDDRLTVAANEFNMAKRTVEDLSFQRQLETNTFEANVMYAAGTGIAEAVDKQMQSFMDAYPTYEAEAKTALEQKARDLLSEAVKNRYFKLVARNAGFTQWLKEPFRKGGSRRIFEPIYNTAQAEKDIVDALSGPNAPAALIKQILETNTPPIGGLTPEEADILVKDPKFVNEQMRNVMMKAIPIYARSNGMSEKTIDGLVRGTEWGAAAIDAYINDNEKAREMITKYESSGGHISRGLLERMGPGWLIKFLAFLGMIGLSPLAQANNNP